MKHLGKISVDLFYRHFSQDSLNSIKEITKINSLKVITYTPISAFKSTFKFINDNFVTKSNEATIIFGLTGLNSDVSPERLQNEIIDICNSSNKNLNIYVHTRCHIKMLSADEELLLGTQNISSTSSSFYELSKLNYNKIFSNHELIIKIHDKENSISDSIIDEALKDNYSCFNIIKDGISKPLNYKKILYLYDYKTILEHMDIIILAADEISHLNSKIDTSKWYLEIEDCVEIVDLCQEIHNGHSKEHYILTLSKFLTLVVGEDTYLRDELNISPSIFNLMESLEKIPLLSGRDASINNHDISSILANIFTEITISDINDECFHNMLNKIKDIIFYASLFDKEHLIEHMNYEVISQIEGSLGNYDLSKYVDNDANISRESIQEAIYNNDISLERQIYTLSEHVKQTSIDISEVILDEFKSITKNRINKAKEILELKLNNEYSYFKP